MYLKSLKVVGFKSFADRTRLEFRPGVTVVVGPNGSGKSNLVDALSWVLGTQSTKTLRTGKMEDVIFAGTTARPSLGRAEATLVIDNAERRLDIDLDEVAITRRLYRDGSSDYELNGVGCRLLDIQDLLSDSGVGRHQHVIIGQGEIGQVLNASPDDHRAVIEEAAGILKHRRRKEKAERRLERTAEDMVRLDDVLGELTRQMRPLKRQARAAELYHGVRADVTALSLYLGGQALAGHDRDLTIAVSERAMLSEQGRVDERRISELGSSLTELAAKAREVGAALDVDTSAAASLETTLERVRRIGSVAREKSRSAAGRMEAVVERTADLEAEREALGVELEAITSDFEAAAGRVDVAEARFRQIEDEERAVVTQASLSPEGALAAVRGELSALEAALIRDERERAAVVRRAEVLASVRRADETEIQEINEEIRTSDEEITIAQEAYRKASEARSADQQRWESAEEMLEQARLEHLSATARVEAMTAALDWGLDTEVREITENAVGAIGSLVSNLDVPQGLERAVDAALGSWARAVAFDDREGLLSAVTAVKGSGRGAIPVVSAMTAVPSRAREVAASVGTDALLDLLGPEAHPGLASTLLGDVLVVEDWMAGWELVARHPGLRAVTTDGDVVAEKGVRLAYPETAGPALLETAGATLERASTELARSQSIHRSARREFEASRNSERAALETLEAVEARVAGRSEVLARLQQKSASNNLEAERLQQRKSALAEAMEGTNGQVKSLRARLEALEGEEAGRMRAWEELEARRVQLAAEQEVARAAWHEADGSLREVTERKRLLEDRLARVRADLDRVRSGAVAGPDQESLGFVVATARQAALVLERRISELRDRQGHLRAENEVLIAAVSAARDEHEAVRESLAESRDRIARLDVRITETRLHREAVIESIRRDADAAVDAAMTAARPDVPEDADLAQLLESKLAQLRRMGPINPLAVEEYKELSERHAFLSAQMADVESSRSELRKVIATLESEIESRFAAAFAEVSQAFERYFQVLFPGGRGRMRLLEPDDQRSGVVIDAQPFGKKVSHMTLLSGGERSLAALAFLFAIFEARPSPFYVLDEVEAALDDANLRRFLRVVEEFRVRAQLLVVTHQQQTMEAADVLYGVTMEPGGSSQVIRKDMARAVTSPIA